MEETSETGCIKCGKPMPTERLELGLTKCKDCSPQGRPKGVMVYSHKTAGSLAITDDADAFQQMKQSADDGVERL